MAPRAPTWRKSSRSQNASECVEVKLSADEVGVRDTKDRPGGQLTVPADAWQAALNRLRQA